MSNCPAHGEGFTEDAGDCIECKKKSKRYFNSCKKETFHGLVNETNSDNDDIIRMTLNDDDWEYYCKKIIKRTPKTQYEYGHFINAPKRGRKKKIKEDDTFSASKLTKDAYIKSGSTDVDLSEFLVG